MNNNDFTQYHSTNGAAVGLNIRNNQFAVGVDNKKNIINNSSIHDKKSPEYVEFTQKCVQAILEVNYELIRACIEYQKQGWARLRSNLSYLATIADELNGNPSGNVIKSVNLPDLTPLPIPRGLVGQKLNSLIQQAVQIFSDHKKFHPNNSNKNQILLNNAYEDFKSCLSYKIDKFPDPSSSAYPPTTINHFVYLMCQRLSDVSHRFLTLLIKNIILPNYKIIIKDLTESYGKDLIKKEELDLLKWMTMAQQFQQNQSAQQQQNMTDYNAAIMAVAAATNQDSDAYNILRPLVRIMPSSIIGFPTGFMTTADAVTNTGIGNTGYNPTNAYHMVRYPSTNSDGISSSEDGSVVGVGGSGNNMIAGNLLVGNSLENNVIGINDLAAVNGFGNSGIPSSTIELGINE
ncbi:9165_t:CDS:10 [Entrophospora sp. SA101]|nr:9165_t:CDS:10 [Entrophospora sp. SA101]